MPDAHEAAVEAMARELHAESHAASDVPTPIISCARCRRVAQQMLTALMRSEAVRAALVEAKIAGHKTSTGYVFNSNETAADVTLAALAPEAT